MIPIISTNLVLCSTYENMIWSRKNLEFSNFGLVAGMFIIMSVGLNYLANCEGWFYWMDDRPF